MMSFLGDGLLNYLKDRPTGKKFLDVIMVVTAATWISFAWVFANYFPEIKHVFISQKVDMKNLVRLDKSINDVLNIMMKQTNSDRAALSRFHNSIMDVLGKHFVYESRSNEVVQPGVSSSTPLRQNLLVSMFNKWMVVFVKNDCIEITDLVPSDQFYEYFRQIGVKSSVKCPVMNTEFTLVGYIVVEYTTHRLAVDELKQQEHFVKEAAEKIGAILSVRIE